MEETDQIQPDLSKVTLQSCSVSADRIDSTRSIRSNRRKDLFVEIYFVLAVSTNILLCVGVSINLYVQGTCGRV